MEGSSSRGLRISRFRPRISIRFSQSRCGFLSAAPGQRRCRWKPCSRANAGCSRACVTGRLLPGGVLRVHRERPPDLRSTGAARVSASIDTGASCLPETGDARRDEQRHASGVARRAPGMPISSLGSSMLRAGYVDPGAGHVDATQEALQLGPRALRVDWRVCRYRGTNMSIASGRLRSDREACRARPRACRAERRAFRSDRGGHVAPTTRQPTVDPGLRRAALSSPGLAAQRAAAAAAGWRRTVGRSQTGITRVIPGMIPGAIRGITSTRRPRHRRWPRPRR